MSYRVIEIFDDPKLDRASGVRSYTCSDLYEMLQVDPDIAPLIKCLSLALPQADAIFSALFNLSRPPKTDWSRFSDVVNLLLNLEHLTIKNFRLPLHQPMLEPVLSIVQRNIPHIQCIVWFPNLYPLWNAERSLIETANNVFRVTNLTLVAVLLEEHLERILQDTKETLRHLSLIWNCALEGWCSPYLIYLISNWLGVSATAYGAPPSNRGSSRDDRVLGDLGRYPGCHFHRIHRHPRPLYSEQLAHVPFSQNWRCPQASRNLNSNRSNRYFAARYHARETPFLENKEAACSS
jgi:hypothetical protein